MSLELIAENRAGISVLMRPLSGNSSAKTSFHEVITRPIDQLQTAGVAVLVTDRAGYTSETWQALAGTSVTWVMSVPATLSHAKTRLEDLGPSTFSPLVEGYDAARVAVSYAGVEQRWRVIRSEAARKRARGTAERQLLKRSEEERQRFDRLCRQAFACMEDATGALATFEAACRGLHVTQSITEQRHFEQAGRPAHDANPERVTYHVEGHLMASTMLEERIERASRCILATNDTAGEVLTDAEVLAAYQDQSKGERGFRFLKDPMVLASTLFLKKAERIMALLLVMTLWWLVYAALEQRIRSVLQENGATVPDQKKKSTSRPTARWVFELFMDVHLLFLTQQRVTVLVMNLKDELRTLLELLGPTYAEAYS